MKSIMKHSILEQKLKVSFVTSIVFVSLGVVLGIMSLILPIPEDAMMIAGVLAIVCGSYAVGLRDADLTLYKSQRHVEQVKE